VDVAGTAGFERTGVPDSFAGFRWCREILEVVNDMFGFLARLVWGAIAAFGVLMSASAQPTPAFDHMVVFGDSLSDIGNAGRFSNGLVWVERLAAQLKVALQPSQAGGWNFAVGGARLDPSSGPHSLRAQADLFLARGQPSGRTLHIIYGGGNDMLAAVGLPDSPKMVETAVNSLRSIVADLAEHGATDLLLPNLPDIGMTPEIRARGSKAMADARRLSDSFNDQVDRALSELARSWSRAVNLYRLDVRTLAERARKDPAAFGFVDVTTPCSGLSGWLFGCAGYLFWDGVHPTTQAHGRLADAARQVVSLP
jgi:phospholipase/lecithinase/hemolysin